ncbi:MAG: anti-sigma factor domain-containing protein [Armatimonadota bacterium]
MRNTVRLIFVALAIMLLMAASVQAAGVNNVQLTASGTTGVTGMATTIVGDIAGPNPYSMVEINMRMDQMPAANMVYQGWLIDSRNNVRTSLGIFRGDRLTHRMTAASFNSNMPYDQLAVSLEPARDADAAPATIVATGTRPGTTIASSDFRGMAVMPEDEMFQRQLMAQRFNLTNDQLDSLRMMAFDYSDIALVSNVAQRCNRMPMEVASMLQQGQSWNQIATTCNTTVAMLMDPIPMQAVAGFRGEATPGMGSTMGTMFYGRLPNGRPVVTWDTWQQLQRRGYTWREVAVAANISAMTGEDINDILRAAKIQGQTFSSIAMDRGIVPATVMDVDDWPFSRNGDSMMMESTPAETGAFGNGTMNNNGTTNY